MRHTGTRGATAETVSGWPTTRWVEATGGEEDDEGIMVISPHTV
jgi:hypothetical protein